MSKQPAQVRERARPAEPDDIRHILGELDDGKLLDIEDLRPSIRDLEQAAMWLSGDPDVYGAGEPVRGVASKIVTILTEDEEDEVVRWH